MPPPSTRVYDLAMTHALDSDDFFIHRIQQHAATLGLNFFLIEPAWIQPFHQKLESGEIWCRALLNMHSEHHLPEDAFTRLVRLAHEKRSHVIDPPDIALAAFDKAALHPLLELAGLKVPRTVIVAHDEIAGFRLTEVQKALLGSTFVIKPNLGYGRKGVILDARDESDLTRSATAWTTPKYLLQEKIVPSMHASRPAYFRVYYVFGSIWCCWWNCFTDQYRIVQQHHFEQFGLHKLNWIVAQIAKISRMSFFSTEICQTEAGEFVLIDYVNDQCHMLAQSANSRMGVPDDVVAGIARRLVEGINSLIQKGHSG